MNFHDAVVLLGLYFLGRAYSEGKDGNGNVNKDLLWTGLYFTFFGAGNAILSLVMGKLQ